MSRRTLDFIGDLIGGLALVVILWGGLFIATFSQPVTIEHHSPE